MDFIIKALVIVLLLVLIRHFLSMPKKDDKLVSKPLWLLELQADKEALRSLRAARDEKIETAEKEYNRAVRALFSKEGKENE